MLMRADFERVQRRAFADAGGAETPSVAPSPSGDGPFLGLGDLLGILWRRRLWIVLPTLACLSLAVLYGSLASPRYTSSLQILIDPRVKRITGSEVSPTGLGSEQAADPGLVESQVAVLTSKSVLMRVIEAEHLDQDPEYTGPSLTQRLLGRVPPPPSSDADLRNGIYDILAERVRAKRPDRSYIVTLEVTSREPQKSARLAHAIADAYLAEEFEARSQSTRKVGTWFADRLEELQKRVRDAEGEIQAYKRRYNLTDAEGRLVNEQQITELNNLLVAARGRAAEAKARLDQVQAAIKTGAEAGSFPEAVRSGTITALRTQYAEASRRAAEAATLYGARHPARFAVQKEVDDLRRLIGEEVARLTASAKAEHNSARASELDLERRLDALRREAVDTNDTRIRLRELEREAAASKAILEAFLLRAKETNQQSSLELPNSRVIGEASPPAKPNWPNMTLLAAVALVAGLGFGTGGAFLSEYLDERIRTARGLRSLTPVRVAGALPRPPRRWLGLLPALSPLTVARDEPRSPYALALGRLWQGLRRGGGRQRRLTLLVTSTEADASAALAFNLAFAAAMAGERVRLIAAGPEGAAVGRPADQAEWGLLDVLAGEVSLAQAVRGDPASGVQYLPLHGRSNAAVKPVDVARLADLIERCARAVDVTIIEAGPAAAQPWLDLLADQADTVLVAVQAGETSRQALERTLGLIENAGGETVLVLAGTTAGEG